MQGERLVEPSREGEQEEGGAPPAENVSDTAPTPGRGFAVFLDALGHRGIVEHLLFLDLGLGGVHIDFALQGEGRGRGRGDARARGEGGGAPSACPTCQRCR